MQFLPVVGLVYCIVAAPVETPEKVSISSIRFLHLIHIQSNVLISHLNRQRLGKLNEMIIHKFCLFVFFFRFFGSMKGEHGTSFRFLCSFVR